MWLKIVYNLSNCVNLTNSATCSPFFFHLIFDPKKVPGIDELRKTEKKPHKLKIEKLASVPYEEALGRKTTEEETYIEVPRRIIGGLHRVSYILQPR